MNTKNTMNRSHEEHKQTANWRPRRSSQRPRPTKPVSKMPRAFPDRSQLISHKRTLPAFLTVVAFCAYSVSASESPEIFKARQRVLIHGLKDAIHFNGTTGTLIAWDPTIGHWKIQHNDGPLAGEMSPQGFSPVNLRPCETIDYGLNLKIGQPVRVGGFTSAKSQKYNGKYGTLIGKKEISFRDYKATYDSSATKNKRYELFRVKLNSGNTLLLQPEKCRLHPGPLLNQLVEISGLTNSIQHNGKFGRIINSIIIPGEEYSKKYLRHVKVADKYRKKNYEIFRVEFLDSSPTITVKPENCIPLQKIPPRLTKCFNCKDVDVECVNCIGGCLAPLCRSCRKPAKPLNKTYSPKPQGFCRYCPTYGRNGRNDKRIKTKAEIREWYKSMLPKLRHGRHFY